jgi:hypothetical protein
MRRSNRLVQPLSVGQRLGEPQPQVARNSRAQHGLYDRCASVVKRGARAKASGHTARAVIAVASVA